MTKRTRKPATNMIPVENALGEWDVIEDGQWIAGPFPNAAAAWAWIDDYEEEQAQRPANARARALAQIQRILEADNQIERVMPLIEVVLRNEIPG
jgi:hypothetical protein